MKLSYLTTPFVILAQANSLLRFSRLSIQKPTTVTNLDKTRYDKRSCTKRRLSYVPPELDPEYNKDIRASTKSNPINPNTTLNVQMNQNELFPIPKFDDIVRFKGKWENSYEYGRLLNLYYQNQSKSWMADIIPFMEEKANQVLIVDKKSKIVTEPLKSLQPAQSYYVRSENGYKLVYKKNSTEVALKGLKYRDLDVDFVFKTKNFNITSIQKDYSDYNDLKNRIISYAFGIGLVGSLVSFLLLGPDVSLSYFLGSGSGIFYFYLLGVKTDSIGFSVANKNSDSNILTKLANIRLALPLVMVSLLSYYNYVAGDSSLGYFHLLTKEQFLASMLGFLNYFISIFILEVLYQIKVDDLIGVLPGSFTEALRLSKKSADTSAVVPNTQDLYFFTGPKVAGRNSLSTKILSRLPVSKGKNKILNFRSIKFLSTSKDITLQQPSKFEYISSEKLAEMVSQGEIIYEGFERGLFDTNIPIALSRYELIPKSSSEIQILEGPPDLLNSLSGLSGYNMHNIWISMQTKEQFISKATEILKLEISQNSALSKDSGDTKQFAQKCSNEISDMVNQAAQDINFYMKNAPMFEFTILNEGSEEEALSELESVLSPSLYL